MTLRVIALSFVLAGCASSVAVRVPTVPLVGQTAAQIDRDTQECEAAAPAGMDDRGLAYGACMIARGYRAWVEVPIWSLWGENHTAYMVTPVNGVTARDVAADVRWCGRVVDKMARPALGTRVGMATVGVFLTGVPFHAADTEAVDRTYRECMEPRGYRVEVWRPER